MLKSLKDTPSLDSPIVAEFFRETRFNDDVASAQIWERYLASRSPSSEAELVTFYLPLVKNIVTGMAAKRRYADNLEEMISDGCLGLLKQVRKIKAFEAGTTLSWIITRITGAIQNGWVGRSKSARRGVSMRGERSALYMSLRYALKRNPSRSETDAALKDYLAANPDLKFQRALPFNFSEMEKEDFQSVRTFVDHRTLTPDAVLMRREAMALATQGLSNDERKILFRRMDGIEVDRPDGCGAGFTANIVLNANERRLLWSLRCRARLASSLGVRHWNTKVPINRRWEPVSMRRVPPAEILN